MKNVFKMNVKKLMATQSEQRTSYMYPNFDLALATLKGNQSREA